MKTNSDHNPRNVLDSVAADAPKPGQLYLHYRAGLYFVESIALREADWVPVVVYRPLGPADDPTRYTRPLADFVGTVDSGDGQRAPVPRFAAIHVPTEASLLQAIESSAALSQPIARMLPALRAHYNEAHRYYHGWSHILSLFEYAAREKIALTDEQLLAILYHDVVYVAGAPSGSNEQLSALLLRAHGQSFAAPRTIDVACSMILDTGTHRPSVPGSALVQDLDLSVLALPATQFRAATELVWLENKHLLADRQSFDQRRKAFLLDLAANGPIYHGLISLEPFARANLASL